MVAQTRTEPSRALPTLETIYRPSAPLDLLLTLAPLRHGHFDPTVRLRASEAWRATRTPHGAASIRLAVMAAGVHATAWGPGAEWLIAALPELLGERDEPERLRPTHPLLRELVHRFSGLRLGRSNAVFEALIPAVLEQKVTGIEARRSYRALLGRYGEPAPGPLPLRTPPAPEVLASLPYHAFHPLGIEQRRADVLRRAGRVAVPLEAGSDLPLDGARRRLLAAPGVGPWTAAEVARVAWGDPDAVSVGDYHMPSVVAWALAGERSADDARMLELLEPYRGQRGRVVRLLEAAGIQPPRAGPRAAPRRIQQL